MFNILKKFILSIIRKISELFESDNVKYIVKGFSTIDLFPDINYFDKDSIKNEETKHKQDFEKIVGDMNRVILHMTKDKITHNGYSKKIIKIEAPIKKGDKNIFYYSKNKNG